MHTLNVMEKILGMDVLHTANKPFARGTVFGYVQSLLDNQLISKDTWEELMCYFGLMVGVPAKRMTMQDLVGKLESQNYWISILDHGLTIQALELGLIRTLRSVISDAPAGVYVKASWTQTSQIPAGLWPVIIEAEFTEVPPPDKEPAIAV